MKEWNQPIQIRIEIGGVHFRFVFWFFISMLIPRKMNNDELDLEAITLEWFIEIFSLSFLNDVRLCRVIGRWALVLGG